MRDKQTYGYSEGGRAFRADLVTDDYAATVAVQWHNDLITILSDQNPLAQKRAALAAMLTYAKDIYYHVYTHQGERERWFGVGAGQSLGRFPAAALFAALASDSSFAAVVKRASQTQLNLGAHSIHELDQVNMGVNGPVWGDGDADVALDQFASGRHWGEMLNRQSFNGAQYSRFSRNSGQRTVRDPYAYIDGPGGFPGTVYASISAGPMRALAAQMFLMPQMCDIVNYDALITYSLRITSEGRKVDGDPCAPPDPREVTQTIIDGLASEGVNTQGMLHCDTFRARNCRFYGLSNNGAPTWGPDPEDRRKCLLDSPALARSQGRIDASGNPILGRFTHLTDEQRVFDVGFRVLPVEKNWALIHQGRSACVRTSKALPLPPTGFDVEVLP